jgi:hypothetical protein
MEIARIINQYNVEIPIIAFYTHDPFNTSLKRCGRCRIEKPLDTFYNLKYKKDTICKECRSHSNKAYRTANRDKIRERVKAYRRKKAINA